MAAAALLRISPHLLSSTRRHQHHRLPSSFVSPLPALSPAIRLPHPRFTTFTVAAASSEGEEGGGERDGGGGGGGGGSGLRRRTGGGDDGSRDDDDGDSSSSGSSHLSILGLFLQGWRSRVAADPQFPFKVLMEELVGVTACVLGDMASRPNFGLNELDFVFSTLVVGSILNFVLMYLLAPTAAAPSSSPSLPSLFAGCPSSHMFETGTYSLPHRLGTFVYKGALFAAVGFAAGLVGTAISNALISTRKKLDPGFESPNKPPPTLLNALTWAAHMGLSSNLRYQTLNGVEFLLANGLPPMLFKGSVVALRCVNNILGGVSFVVLARLTGSQKQAPPAVSVIESDGKAELMMLEDKEEEKEKMAVAVDDLQGNQSTAYK